MRNYCTFLLLMFSFLLYADIPAHYYDATDGKNKGELKTALYHIIKDMNAVGYNNLWQYFPQTDMRPDSTVWDMYSNTIYHFDGTNPVLGMDREHSLPKSWWGGTQNNAYSDLYNLYPSDRTANSTAKNSYTMAVIDSTVTFDNGVVKGGFSRLDGGFKAWEPGDEYKGDFARIYMYMVTCYEYFSTQDMWVQGYVAKQFVNSTNTYPVFNDWTTQMLLQWNAQDPVSTKELNRNEKVYQIQGNRNPFIDCPILAEYIWGSKKDEPFSVGLIGTQPYISKPLNNSKVAFTGIVGESASLQIPVQGFRLTQPIHLELHGENSNKFSLDSTSISPADAMNGCEITINYLSEILTTDTVELHLTSPELHEDIHVTLIATTNDTFTLLKTNITNNSFTINWTPSFDATGYKVTVYTLKNIGEKGDVVKIDVDFSKLTSVPAGWTRGGTTLQADGLKMASASNLGFITTPSIEFLGDKATVFVRAKTFNTSDRTPAVTVACGSTELATFETSANYQMFSKEFSTTGFTNNTITFSAKAGKRVVIDSVKIVSYEEIESPVPLDNYPKIEITNSHFVGDLEEEHTYYFTVQPQGGSNTHIYGPFTVFTTLVPIRQVSASNIVWGKEDNYIWLQNVKKGDEIMLTDITGKVLHKKKAATNSERIPLTHTDLYILTVNFEHFKILN